jgi:thiamine biosynthesis lipoprotein
MPSIVSLILGIKSSATSRSISLPDLNHSLSRCKPLLGTYVEVILSGNCSEDDLFDLSLEVFDTIQSVEDLLSFHNPESELSQINQSAHLRTVTISTDLQRVLELALELSRLTEGDYDITIAPKLIENNALPQHPGDIWDEQATWKDIQLNGNQLSFKRPLRIDLGGIAKGYAVDQAIEVAQGRATAIINAGGDLRMTDWQGQTVQVRIPGEDSSHTAELPMTHPAVASSASYFIEGDAVIIHPKTGRSIDNEDGRTVFANSCMLADALTKVAFVSPHAAEIIKRLDSSSMIINEHGVITPLSESNASR